jgi:hypothetical protein
MSLQRRTVNYSDQIIKQVEPCRGMPASDAIIRAAQSASPDASTEPTSAVRVRVRGDLSWGALSRSSANTVQVPHSVLRSFVAALVTDPQVTGIHIEGGPLAGSVGDLSK